MRDTIYNMISEIVENAVNTVIGDRPERRELEYK